MNMKGKLLLIIGLLLVTISLALAILATSSMDVIGGADLPSLFFVFFQKNRGLYSLLAFGGLGSILASILLSKKKRA